MLDYESRVYHCLFGWLKDKAALRAVTDALSRMQVTKDTTKYGSFRTLMQNAPLILCDGVLVDVLSSGKDSNAAFFGLVTRKNAIDRD